MHNGHQPTPTAELIKQFLANDYASHPQQYPNVETIRRLLAGIDHIYTTQAIDYEANALRVLHEIKARLDQAATQRGIDPLDLLTELSTLVSDALLALPRSALAALQAIEQMLAPGSILYPREPHELLASVAAIVDRELDNDE